MPFAHLFQPITRAFYRLFNSTNKLLDLLRLILVLQTESGLLNGFLLLFLNSLLTRLLLLRHSHR